jgi:hypothetical protein
MFWLLFVFSVVGVFSVCWCRCSCGVFAIAGVLVSASVRTYNAVLLACFIAAGAIFLQKALCFQIFQLFEFS